MTAKILNFAPRLPGATSPAPVEADGEPGAPLHGNCAAPLPFLDGARLTEFIGARRAVKVTLTDRSYFINTGGGWWYVDRSGQTHVVTVAATGEQLSAWVLEQRRNASKAAHPCNTNRITYDTTKGTA